MCLAAVDPPPSLRVTALFECVSNPPLLIDFIPADKIISAAASRVPVLREIRQNERETTPYTTEFGSLDDKGTVGHKMFHPN